MTTLIGKTLIAGAIGAAALCAGSASAATFNPFDVVAPGAGSGTHSFTADKITGNYNETITITGNTFNVALYWSAGQFVGNGGESAYDAKTTGLGHDYGLYALYTAAGTINMVNGKTEFSFDQGGSLAMYLDRNLNTTVGMPGVATGAFVLGASSDDVLLASGDPLSGFGTLDPGLPTCAGAGGGSGINCGSFGSTTSFELTSTGSSFFVAPNPFYQMSFQSGHLNNFVPSGTQQINGSLDVVFDLLPGPNQVPEPASLGLLGLGLLGLGVARRRKQG